MASSWIPSKLSDVVEIHTGKISVDEAELADYISTDNLLPDFGGVNPAEKMPATGKVTTYKVGDILFSNIRTYFKKLWLADKSGFCSNDVIVFSPKNGIECEYIYHLLMNDEFIEYTVKTSKGTKMPRGDKDAIMKYEFLLAPQHERKFIGDSLVRYKKKIELNRQTNQTLEQMAQALFKSWFVDFDPVIDNVLAAGGDIPEALQHKAEQRKQAQQLPDFKPLPDDIRALFPSDFEQTDEATIGIAGWIPKGWKNSELSEFMNVKHGFAYKGEYFSDESTNDILLTPGNVAIGGGFKGDKFKFYNGPIMGDYIFAEGDMYITMTDLSKAGDTLGYPAIVPRIEGLTFHHNQRLGKVGFKDINKFGPEFLYRCLCSRNYRSYIIASATGTTVKHTSPTKILQHKVINSGGLVEPFFEQYVKHLSAKKELNNMNSIDLAKTRDVLLPKLISGELEVTSNDT